jgi:hypothetical protein
MEAPVEVNTYCARDPETNHANHLLYPFAKENEMEHNRGIGTMAAEKSFPASCPSIPLMLI